MTMTGYTETERQALTRLQRGIELCERPFADFPLAEPELLELLSRARSDGLLRRFGAVFDARRLGYRSVLCALDTPAERIEAKAQIVAAEDGVTHCYERRPLLGGGDYPALWFTLALLHDEFSAGLARLRGQLEDADSRLLELPALRRFKIDVVFDLRTRARDESFPGAAAAADFAQAEDFRVFSERDRNIVRAIDQDIPLVEQPFNLIAERVGIAPCELLEILRDWKAAGILRRVAAVLRHRQAGFKANGMCVWPVAGDIIEAGRRVAAQPEVTHCYQRPRCAELPFDLYAMIHRGDWDATRALYEDISDRCGLKDGEMFASLREFKKSSMQYFK